MLGTYYTYTALAADWKTLLSEDRISSVYSSQKFELSVDLESGSVIVFGSRGSMRYLFRSERRGRPGRNVADLMEAAGGAYIEDVGTAERDRILSIQLSEGREIRFMLFGSTPNALLVERGVVVDAFKRARSMVGREAPVPRPAPRVTSASDFLSRARRGSTPEKAVTSAFVLFDRVLAREVLSRAGVRPEATVEEALESGDRIYEAALQLERRLERSPNGRIYRVANGEIVFSLIELTHLNDGDPEVFDDVDSAVSACARMMLREMRFLREITPLRKSVDDLLQRSERRLREVSEHLEAPGRADRLERFGHLLMASGRTAEQGMELIEVQDHFEEGQRIQIPLEPELTVAANAERYYDRARRSRTSREAARERLEGARAEYARLQQAALELDRVVEMDQLQAFKRAHPELRSPDAGTPDGPASPFRRFALDGGFELWIGRNARENDLLTFDHARKFDIWLHARGVSGSHVVLRRPSRTAEPGSRLLEVAASAAAYYSKARGSELVPVMYTERKYVRKARGGDPGKVIVEREEVVIVPPKLPSS